MGKAIIVITDGEDHEGGAAQMAEMARKKGMRVYMLGVGLPNGAPIPSAENGDYLTDRSGEIVMSRLNEDMCKQIAAAGGGSYIHVDNTNTAQLQLDKELSRLIGIVLTEKPDVRNMTTEDLVGMGRSPYTGFWGTLTADDRQIAAEAIGMVGIESLRGRMIHTLSDGERQKVMIAKTLAQQTPIIYLDEPTAFLDYPSKVEMMQLLRRLAHEQQKTIFLSTHDVELALQLADRLWLMEPNQLSVGTPRQLADDGTLSRFIERDGIVFERDSLTIRIKKFDIT